MSLVTLQFNQEVEISNPSGITVNVVGIGEFPIVSTNVSGSSVLLTLADTMPGNAELTVAIDENTIIGLKYLIKFPAMSATAVANSTGNAEVLNWISLKHAPSATNKFDDYGLATSRTVQDYAGNWVTIPANADPRGGLNPVRNLLAGPTATLATESVTVTAGDHVFSHTGTGTVTFSGAYTGSLVGAGSLAFTTTAGTLTCTVTGSVTDAMLQNKTGRPNPTVADPYVSVGVGTDPHHTGVDGFAYLDVDSLGNSVGPGWLDVQPGATNSNIMSEIGTWTFASGGSGVPQSVYDPNGVEVYSFRESTATTYRSMFGLRQFQAGAGILFCHAKAISGTRKLVLRPSGIGANVFWAAFDLSAGSVHASGGSELLSAGIEQDGDDSEYLCWITFVRAAATGYHGAALSNDGTEIPTYAGDGTSEIRIRNVNYIAGSAVVGAPIPTNGTAVSRSTPSPYPTIDIPAEYESSNETRLTVSGLGDGLLSGDNSTFDSGVGDWSNNTTSNSTLTNPDRTLKIEQTSGTGVYNGVRILDAVAAGIPLVDYAKYLVTFYIRATVANSARTLHIDIGGPASRQVSYANGEWQKRAFVVRKNAINNRIIFYQWNTNDAVGDTLEIGDVQVYPVDPGDTTKRIIDVDNQGEELDIFDGIPIKVHDWKVYAPGERP